MMRLLTVLCVVFVGWTCSVRATETVRLCSNTNSSDDVDTGKQFKLLELLQDYVVHRLVDSLPEAMGARIAFSKQLETVIKAQPTPFIQGLQLTSLPKELPDGDLEDVCQFAMDCVKAMYWPIVQGVLLESLELAPNPSGSEMKRQLSSLFLLGRTKSQDEYAVSPQRMENVAFITVSLLTAAAKNHYESVTDYFAHHAGIDLLDFKEFPINIRLDFYELVDAVYMAAEHGYYRTHEVRWSLAKLKRHRNDLSNIKRSLKTFLKSSMTQMEHHRAPDSADILELPQTAQSAIEEIVLLAEEAVSRPQDALDYYKKIQYSHLIQQIFESQLEAILDYLPEYADFITQYKSEVADYLRDGFRVLSDSQRGLPDIDASKIMLLLTQYSPKQLKTSLEGMSVPSLLDFAVTNFYVVRHRLNGLRRARPKDKLDLLAQSDQVLGMVLLRQDIPASLFLDTSNSLKEQMGMVLLAIVGKHPTLLKMKTLIEIISKYPSTVSLNSASKTTLLTQIVISLTGKAILEMFPGMSLDPKQLEDQVENTLTSIFESAVLWEKFTDLMKKLQFLSICEITNKLDWLNAEWNLENYRSEVGSLDIPGGVKTFYDTMIGWVHDALLITPFEEYDDPIDIHESVQKHQELLDQFYQLPFDRLRGRQDLKVMTYLVLLEDRATERLDTMQDLAEHLDVLEYIYAALQGEQSDEAIAGLASMTYSRLQKLRAAIIELIDGNDVHESIGMIASVAGTTQNDEVLNQLYSMMATRLVNELFRRLDEATRNALSLQGVELSEVLRSAGRQSIATIVLMAILTNLLSGIGLLDDNMNHRFEYIFGVIKTIKAKYNRSRVKRLADQLRQVNLQTSKYEIIDAIAKLILQNN